MKEDFFKEKYEEIEVPKEAVNEAIRKGIQQKDSPSIKQPSRVKKWIISSAAAITLLSSSIFVPSVSQVVADVPLLGKVYSNVNDMIGRSLTSQELITKLDEKASSNGVDVTVTSAYYDGGIIGVTFRATGDIQKSSAGEYSSFYEIFNGSENIKENKEIVVMEQMDNGFAGHIQFHYPEVDLPKDGTVPLEFFRVGDKEGSWKFEVPIKQLTAETKNLNEVSANKEEGVEVRFEQVKVGKASITVDYTATLPKGERHQVRLPAYYGEKNKELKSIRGVELKRVETSDEVMVKGRYIYPYKEIEELKIHPQVAFSVPDTHMKLDQQTPFKVEAEEQDLSIHVSEVVRDTTKVELEFQINEGEDFGKGFYFYENVARNNVMLVKDAEKEIYQAPIVDNKIEVMDKDKLTFRKSFDIRSIDSFTANDYVVRLQLSDMSRNIPMKLDPVHINLE